jgi:hypothetical protein
MGAGYGPGGLEIGMKVDCDNCERVAAITGIYKNPYIYISGGGRKAGGDAANVLCPYCGKHQDFREVAAQLGDGFEGGITAQCDHCDNNSTIDKVVRQLRVRLAPV